MYRADSVKPTGNWESVESSNSFRYGFFFPGAVYISGRCLFFVFPSISIAFFVRTKFNGGSLEIAGYRRYESAARCIRPQNAIATTELSSILHHKFINYHAQHNLIDYTNKPSNSAHNCITAHGLRHYAGNNARCWTIWKRLKGCSTTITKKRKPI